MLQLEAQANSWLVQPRLDTMAEAIQLWFEMVVNVIISPTLVIKSFMIAIQGTNSLMVI